MRTLRYLLAGLLLLYIWSSPGRAQEQDWTYTGQVMSGGQTTNAATDIIDASLVLAAPLNPNAANQIVTPLSWTFSEPGLSSSLDTPYGGPSATFEFNTVNGQITSWSVEANSNSPPSAEYVNSQVFLSNAGDTFIGQASFVGVNPAYCSQCYVADETSSTAGVWVDPPSAAPAPEISGAGAIAGITLLVGMLLVLRGRRRNPEAPAQWQMQARKYSACTNCSRPTRHNGLCSGCRDILRLLRA